MKVFRKDGCKRMSDEWWLQPRNVSVVVDNDSWILPYAEDLVKTVCEKGDHAVLARSFDDILESGVAFYIGCLRVTPGEVLEKNFRNLVVHESSLPEGKGFSPLSWQILEGRNAIPITIFEATEAVDSGPVVYQEEMQFNGHELLPELRKITGEKTVGLCLRYLSETEIPKSIPQQGKESFYPRRRLGDSELDPDKSLREQFPLLRIVDNDSYPAFFDKDGHQYKLTIEKMSRK